jgi:glutathione S-transferase
MTLAPQMPVPVPVLMYDLAGVEDARRISPFCWRVRMALAHKGLEVETRPWRMVEKEAIAEAGVATVPVIVDRGRMVGDSWAIAEYLDRAYPDRPLLFAGPQARSLSSLVHHWTERLHRLLVPLILREVLVRLHGKDLAYFRASREQAFGKPLEAVMDESPAAFGRFDRALSPLRATLGEHAFLGGAAPAYADYIVFGAFQWARACSSHVLTREAGDPIRAWLGRLSGLYGALAARAPGCVSWADAVPAQGPAPGAAQGGGDGLT